MEQINPILKQSISEFETSIAFKEMCGINGFHNFADILEFPVHELMKKSGMTNHLIIEFMEILKRYGLEEMVREEF